MTYKDDKVLFKSEWIEVREKYIQDMDISYFYTRGPKTGSKSIAVLPYRKTKDDSFEFLLRKERVPPWNQEVLTSCSLTGGHDQDTPWATASKELREEAGIISNEEDLISLGTCRISKSSDYLCYLYSFEVTDKTEQEDAKGDGTQFEEEAKCEWKTKDLLLECVDPIVHIMYNRLANKLL